MCRFVWVLLALAGCAASGSSVTPAGAGGGRDEGASCASHDDCRIGLLCGDEERTCIADDCLQDDDCDRASLGQSRCEPIDGTPHVLSCAYDGYRCLEWSPSACGEGESCQESPTGARCTGGVPDADAADERGAP